MSFQHAELPPDWVRVGNTKTMTEATIPPGLLRNHRTAKDRYGFWVVEKGTLQFRWEDDGSVLDADPQHPIVIFPERLHRVLITGSVTFRVEFYEQVDRETEPPPLYTIDPPRPTSS